MINTNLNLEVIKGLAASILEVDPNKLLYRFKRLSRRYEHGSIFDYDSYKSANDDTERYPIYSKSLKYLISSVVSKPVSTNNLKGNAIYTGYFKLSGNICNILSDTLDLDANNHILLYPQPFYYHQMTPIYDDNGVLLRWENAYQFDQNGEKNFGITPAYYNKDLFFDEFVLSKGVEKMMFFYDLYYIDFEIMP